MQSEYPSDHVACLRANWPEPLSALATPAPELIALDHDTVAELLDKPHGFALLDLLEPRLAESAPMFLKLAGFSFRGMPVFYGTDGRIATVADLRSYCSELPPRMIWSLRHLQYFGVTPQAEIHPWRQIDPDSEFRLTVRDRALTGITHYRSGDAAPRDVQRWTVSVLSAFATTVIPELHIGTVVIDVILDRTAGGDDISILELNPFTGNR